MTNVGQQSSLIAAAAQQQICCITQCNFFQAVESQQCLEGKLTTVQFRKEEVRLPGDFWTRGVDNSKIILETILDKIKSYEQISESSWIEFVRDNFALENLDVHNGEN